MANEVIVGSICGAFATITTALIAWWSNRGKAQAFTEGMVQTALRKALEGVSEELDKTNKRHDDAMKRTDAEIEDIRRDHTNCEVNLRQMREDFQAYMLAHPHVPHHDTIQRVGD